MRWILLTDAKLRYARSLDDDANYVIAGREVEIGPLAGHHAVPARMMDDPACPVGLADYLGTLPSGEYQAAELFAPNDE